MHHLEKSRRLRLILITYIALLIIALIPIWSFKYPPLQDYPNHMARMFIISNIKDNLFLQEFYDVRFAVLPNLSMDIIVPTLSIFFPLEISGKLMLSLTFITLTSGSLLLNLALFRSLSFWPLASFLILFNEALSRGFINFLFGIGVSFLGLSLWVFTRNKKWHFKIVLFSILSTILFFCHLYAFCFYAIAICVYELSILSTSKELYFEEKLGQYLVTLAQFISPTVIYSWSRTPLFRAKHTYASLGQKIIDYPYKLFGQYNTVFDRLTLLFIVFLMGLYIFIAFQGIRRRSKKLSEIPMLFPILTLIFVYFWIPQNLSTTSSSDWRLLIPLFLLFIAAFPPSFNDLQFKVIVPVIVLLFTINVSIIWYNWHKLQPEYREIAQLIENIEEGSRLFPIRGYESYREECYPFIHIPTLAITQKSAFVPSLLAFPTQQPVRFDEKPIHVIREAPIPTCPRYRESIYREANWDQVIESYDYILISREELFGEDIPKSSLAKVAEGNGNVLYKTLSSQTP